MPELKVTHLTFMSYSKLDKFTRKNIAEPIKFDPNEGKSAKNVALNNKEKT